MAKETSAIYLFSLFFSLFHFFRIESCTCEINGMFVFGSSLVDNGNNNFLENASAKADYLPYGIDFPQGPSGRFSNGKNVIDVLGELLKLPSFIPPFMDPMTKGTRILHGVNFASGGSGILDETGSISGEVISLNDQVRHFEMVTLPELKDSSGERGVSNHLFVIGTGGNDYFLNYFISASTNNVTIEDFTTRLTSTLSLQLKKLYHLGARKFVLISVYPIGCIPAVKVRVPETLGCIDSLNQAALLFNTQMKLLVDSIKPQMPGSNLVYVNSYAIITNIIEDPISKGFNDTSMPCCEVLLKGGILCKKEGHSCGYEERKTHVFFDGLHPTEAVNNLIANKAYASNLTSEAYPINVQQLASL